MSDDVVVFANLVWPGGTPERTRELADRLFHVPGGIVVGEGADQDGPFVLFQMIRSQQMANAVIGLLQRRGRRLGVEVARLESVVDSASPGTPQLIVHVEPARAAKAGARAEASPPAVARLPKVGAQARSPQRRSSG